MARSLAAEIRLTEQEEAVLRSWTRKSSGEQRLVDRARIILMSHEGVHVEEIASDCAHEPRGFPNGGSGSSGTG